MRFIIQNHTKLNIVDVELLNSHHLEVTLEDFIELKSICFLEKKDFKPMENFVKVV